MPDEAPKTPPRLVSTRRAPEPTERNPYAPPRAELAREAVEDPGEWRDWGAVVPALHGLLWIRDAFRTLWARPWTWLGALLLFLLCFGLVRLLNRISVPDDGWVHWLGSLSELYASSCFFTLSCGGFAHMAHRQWLGEDVRALDVLGGFRGCFVRLALLGVVEALLLIGWLYYLGYAKSHTALLKSATGIDFDAGIIPLYITWVFPLCFPPTLAAVAGSGAFWAMLAGTVAVFRNWKAFLVNAVVFGAVCQFCLRFTGWVLTLAQETSAGFGDDLSVVCHYAALAFLWLFSLFCVMLLFLTGYTASRDIFYEEG